METDLSASLFVMNLFIYFNISIESMPGNAITNKVHKGGVCLPNTTMKCRQYVVVFAKVLMPATVLNECQP